MYLVTCWDTRHNICVAGVGGASSLEAAQDIAVRHAIWFVPGKKLTWRKRKDGVYLAQLPKQERCYMVRPDTLSSYTTHP